MVLVADLQCSDLDGTLGVLNYIINPAPGDSKFDLLITGTVASVRLIGIIIYFYGTIVYYNISLVTVFFIMLKLTILQTQLTMSRKSSTQSLFKCQTMEFHQGVQ